MTELTRLCPLCDGSQRILIGDRKGEQCDYCIDGQLLTAEGALLARLIERFIKE